MEMRRSTNNWMPSNRNIPVTKPHSQVIFAASRREDPQNIDIRVYECRVQRWGANLV